MERLLKEYLDFYRDFVSGNYNILPEDRKILEDNGKLIHYDSTMGSHSDFVNAFQSEDKYKIADYMIPDPFAGDIENARIFFITANPKLGPDDYDLYRRTMFGTPEYLNNCMRKVIIQDRTFLKQYPFWAIHEHFNFTGGYYWWFKRRNAAALITKLNNDLWNVGWEEAVVRFAKLFTNVELLPYRSQNFDIRTAKKLKAYQININFIENYLIPKALKGEILIIFSWGAKHFDLPVSDNIYMLPSKQAQGLTLNPDAQAVEIGRIIFNYIKNNHL